MNNSEIVYHDILRREEKKMIKALKGHVIARNIDDDVRETASGLIIPDNYKRHNMICVVTDSALGDVPVGTYILVGRRAGKHVKYNKEDYRAISGDDILALTDEHGEEIHPVSDYLLVKNAPRDTKVGQLYIPGKKKEDDEFLWATVVKVGPGRMMKNNRMLKTTVEAGNEVLYGPYCSYALKADTDLVLVRESDVEMVKL